MSDSRSETDPPDPDAAAVEGSAGCLDCRGLLCPEPLMLVRNRVRELPAGAVLAVVATDPSTRRDFSNFCRFMGHELLEDREADGLYHFRIRKGAGP